MNQEMFVDGISAIHITGNTIRIDFYNIQPQLKHEQNDEPVVEVTRRVIMPLEGFLQSIGLQNKIVQQLMEAGIVQQSDKIQK